MKRSIPNHLNFAPSDISRRTGSFAHYRERKILRKLRLVLGGGKHAIKTASFTLKYGFRVCPGMSLAENSVFLAIATLLYVFSISKAKDADGEDITPAVEYDGFIWYVVSLC